MEQAMVIVGGGIGGLAAALAAARAGMGVRLVEQAHAFGEVGAGIQLGPNVVKVLESWGLGDALRSVAAFPTQLEVRNALTAKTLGTLPLGAKALAQYGAAYATLARADLHGLLLQAVQAYGVSLQLATPITHIEEDEKGVQLHTAQGRLLSTPLLVGADGLWSQVREHLLPQAPPRSTGAPGVSGHGAARRLASIVAQPGGHGLAGPEVPCGAVPGAWRRVAQCGGHRAGAHRG